MNSYKLTVFPCPGLAVIILRRAKIVVVNALTVKAGKSVRIGCVVVHIFQLGSISVSADATGGVRICLYTGYVADSIILVNKGFVKGGVGFRNHSTALRKRVPRDATPK